VEGFASIVGQPRALERLRGAAAAGTAHHAYLFDGPAGVGKARTALALAQALNCDERAGEGCGRCEPCRKLAAGLHPDLLRFEVEPEKGQTERMRELVAQLGFPPHEGRARVIAIDPADGLNQQAANVLLKTLEEPPPRTHFVLVTSMAASLLPTVRSRCLRVRFGPLDDETVARALTAEHGLDEGSAREAAALSGGSLGQALALASSEELPARRERAARLLAATRAGRAALLDAAAEVAGDRDEAEATLDLMWVTYRDALLEAEGLAEGRVPADRRAAAAELAARAPTRLVAGLRAVEEAREAVRGYVAPQLAFERLLIALGQAGAA
jgi:DNA polymerase-3 subunit delta'